MGLSVGVRSLGRQRRRNNIPYNGFTCSKCPQPNKFTREEALLHFPNEHGGVVPGAVIEAIWRGEESSRRADSHISPSMAGGCTREYAINRSFDMLIDPLRVWAMLEGTVFHKALQLSSPPGWLAEVELPFYYLKTHDTVTVELKGEENKTISLGGKNFRRQNGVWEYEVFPGLYFSMQLDQLRGDYQEIVDYKTKNCPMGF